ncbi:MAG: tetratricopeptide repeat protein [Candidatus Thiodiazotropha sp.]
MRKHLCIIFLTLISLQAFCVATAWAQKPSEALQTLLPEATELTQDDLSFLSSYNFSWFFDVLEYQTEKEQKVLKDKQNSVLEMTWLGVLSEEDKELINAVSNLVGVDHKKAINLVQPHAKQGNPNYQYLMGLLHVSSFNKQSVSKSNTLQIQYWCTEAASNGHPNAQYQLGQLHRLGIEGFEADLNLALKWYIEALNNPNEITRSRFEPGDIENQIARIYSNDSFLGKDEKEADKYYHMAAAKGNKYALTSLGAMAFRKGNFEEFLELTKKSADQGYSPAMLSLAVAYLTGSVTVLPDHYTYRIWVDKAIANGNVDAMFHLADYFQNMPYPFPENLKKAAKYYQKAAREGNKRAQYLFAELNEAGTVIEKDLIRAYLNYNAAYVNGYEEALQSLNRLKTQLLLNCTQN